MTFTTKRLTGHRVLVRGTDADGANGETVLDSAQWDSLNNLGQFDQAAKAFDEAVENFFAPVIEAAETLEAAASVPDNDPTTYVVVQEGVEPTTGEPRVVELLSHDSIVLRLIEEGKHDRLIWVGDSLEVTEATFPSSSTSAPAPAAGLGVSSEDHEQGRVYTD